MDILFCVLWLRQTSVHSSTNERLGCYFPSYRGDCLELYLTGGGNWLILNKLPSLDLFVKNILFANWFLSVLFILSVIVAVVEKFGGHYKSILYFVSTVIIYLLPNIWYTAYCKWLMPYFLLAIVLSRFDWHNTNWQLTVVAAYVFGVSWHLFSDNPALLKVGTNIGSWVFHTDVITRTLAGIAGCIVTIYLCKLLFKLKATYESICYLGSISLPIYVIHVQICEVNDILHFATSNIMILMVVTIAMIAIPILTYRFCRRSRVLMLVLFGETTQGR